MKYAYLVLLGVLIAVLAGCSSGGDGGKGDRIAELEADLEMIQEELREAQGELATTTDTLTDTQGDLETTKETLTDTQGDLGTTQETLKTAQDDLAALNLNVNALLLSAGVESLTELSTKLREDAQAFATLQGRVEGLLTQAGVMTLAELSTKLTDDARAYNTLDSQVQGLLIKAGVETLAALSTKLDDDEDAYNTLDGDVQTVLTATGAMDLTDLQTLYNTAKSDLTNLNTRVQGVLDATGADGLMNLQTLYNKAKSDYDDLDTMVQAVLNATSTTDLDQSGTRDVRDLQALVASLRGAVTSLQTQLGDARDDEREANQQAQTLEANQRAENLRQAFQGSDGETELASPLGDLPVTITVPARNNLRFEHGDRTARSISAPGLRGARLTRTRGGTDTTVVYTDRELSRELLDHYASTESDDNPGQFGLPSDVLNPGSTDFIAQSASTEPIAERISISHNLDRSVDDDDERQQIGDPETSFSGTVHGISGTFVCEGADCMLTATGNYHPADDDNNPDTRPPSNANRLNTVTLAVSGGGTIHFKPRSATAPVSLCAETAQCLTLADDNPGDQEYMAFGWWRHEPANAVGDYEFGVFANVQGTAGANSTLTGTAEYDGTAVGMYVEQGGLGGTGVTTRQGEFTADVRLDVDFDATDIEGTIDGFRTTPTGGSSAPTTSSTWVVKLEEDSATATGGGSAEIDIRGTNSTGAWSYTFVGNHANAPTGDDQLQPPAVTGTFNSRIPNLLHLVGAFGAERQ